MSSRLPRAVLSLCVRFGATGGDHQPACEDLADRLLDTLSQRQIPVTWAVADPTTSSLARRVIASVGKQEIALALDAPLLDSPQFGREVTRRVSEARSLGLPLLSVAVPNPLADAHYEVLSRLGIVGVCGPRPAGSARRTQAAVPRFGLWCYSDSLSLPGTSRWSAGGGGLRTARRDVSLAISEQGLVQWGIQLDAVIGRGRAAERVVERVIQLAERRRGIGKLDIATLATTSGRLSGHYAGKPSHSILRPAA